MASYKKTDNGNYYAVNEVTGKVINGQPQGGFASASGAKSWAAKNLDAVSTPGDVKKF